MEKVLRDYVDELKLNNKNLNDRIERASERKISASNIIGEYNANLAVIKRLEKILENRLY